MRILKKIAITQPLSDQWFLQFTADGFLYRMVRLLVGTMLRFAQGKLSENELLGMLRTEGALKTSACAPADGLYLTDVRYSDDLQSSQLAGTHE